MQFFLVSQLHIKVMFTLHCSLLSVQQQYVWKTVYIPYLINNAVGKYCQQSCLMQVYLRPLKKKLQSAIWQGVSVMQNSKRIYCLVSPLSERFPWCAGDAHWLVVVQSLSHVHLFVTPWTAECQASLSFIISQSLLRLMSVESVMPSNHLILCHSLLLPSVFPSIRVFSSESALHNRWPKYWSFSFSISPSSEYSALISFRNDSLQSKELSKLFSNAPVWKHQLFGAQPSLWSDSHIRTWLLKNHSFDSMDFVSKVMSLLFHWLLL